MRTASTQSRLRSLHGILAGATVVAVFLIVLGQPEATPASPSLILPGPRPAAEWRTADGSHGAHRSELADINASTVHELEVAWVYRTGDFSGNEDGRAGTAFQATPVMVDGALYFPTPYGRVVALDAESGVERWVFDTGVDRSDRAHKMVTSRGVAVWADGAGDSTAACAVRVLYAPYDARLFALDARRGAPCADFGRAGVVDLRAGVPRIEGREDSYKVTAPPTVVGGVVAVGSTVYDNLRADAPSGVVRGYDVRSGALRWSWEPLEGVGAPDGQRSWVPAGAANTWATMTADEERDLLFVATSSASPDHYGGLRPGDNGYANSVVALRGSTGEVVWHFQSIHHDLWDYDLPAPPALVTVERDGVDLPAVVQGTKLGYLFVLHRETGEPLFPVEERPVPQSDVPGEQTSPTQPVPLLPRPLSRQGLTPEEAWGITPLDRAMCRKRIEALRHDGVFAPPSVRGTVTMPGFLGGVEWGGLGWDRASGVLVVNVNHLATVATLIPTAELEREATRAPAASRCSAPRNAPRTVCAGTPSCRRSASPAIRRRGARWSPWTWAWGMSAGRCRSDRCAT
jgi:quinoprotein glucose dehydrogenase